MRGPERRSSSGDGASLGRRLNTLAENAFSSFVRGRSDEQLERLFGTTPALRMAFGGMERAFVPEKAGGFKGSVQWELHGPRGTRTWHVSIMDDRAVASEGPAPDATGKMRM